VKRLRLNSRRRCVKMVLTGGFRNTGNARQALPTMTIMATVGIARQAGPTIVATAGTVRQAISTVMATVFLMVSSDSPSSTPPNAQRRLSVASAHCCSENVKCCHNMVD